MNNPQFSVVMPVYNAAEHLLETIRSVLNQSERDFEFIMIDDGSTDDSLSLMLSFASEDERIKLVSQKNKGVSGARNLGIGLARGSLVAFIDADDLWDANKLAVHRSFHAENSNAVASYAKVAFMQNDAAHDHQARTFSTVKSGDLSIDQVIAENPVCTMSNLVVRNDIVQSIGKFEAEMSYAEDQEWLARLISKGHGIVGIDEYLVDYRLSPLGLSADLPAMFAGWRQLATQYAPVDQLLSSEAIYCRYLSRRALRAGAPARIALAYAMQGLQADREAFLEDEKRGWLTLLSAFAAFLMPRSTRVHVFA
ncbi:MAG: glycosyltransferase [Parasphingorhabdus sp.]